jgi:hypothetical protein
LCRCGRPASAARLCRLPGPGRKDSVPGPGSRNPRCTSRSCLFSRPLIRSGAGSAELAHRPRPISKPRPPPDGPHHVQLGRARCGWIATSAQIPGPDPQGHRRHGPAEPSTAGTQAKRVGVSWAWKAISRESIRCVDRIGASPIPAKHSVEGVVAGPTMRQGEKLPQEALLQLPEQRHVSAALAATQHRA